MARLFVLLFLAHVVLAACALISCLSAEDGEPRALPPAWVLAILFVPLVGPIAWFLAGRPANSAESGLAGQLVRFIERNRRQPLPPDDDPDFLRSLGSRIGRERTRRDRELFNRWENDLRRREDETHRHGGEPPVDDSRPES